MCGIVGIVSKIHTNSHNTPVENITSSDRFKTSGVLKNLLLSLLNLEYRGYDSVGIATFTLDEKKKLSCVKSIGDLSGLVKKIFHQDLCDTFVSNSDLREFLLKLNINDKVDAAIGHTRWATHGAPSERNAHPQMKYGIAVVHNGIVNNFSELKNALGDVDFQSDTDTELFVHYLHQMKKDGLSTLNAINVILQKFSGNFAVAMIDESEKNKIFAFKKGTAPLILGRNANHNVVASDINSISYFIDEFACLNDGQIVVLDEEKFSCYDASVSYLISENIRDVVFDKCSTDQISHSKNGYEHFMMKEICDQPQIIQQLSNQMNDYLCNLSEFEKIKIIGCGSAYYAGCVAKKFIEKFFNVNVDCEIASEFRYTCENNSFVEYNHKKTLSIFISQSGETFDTVVAHNKSKELGHYTIAIVNTPMSTLSQIADKVIFTYAGVEMSVASTKAVVAQIITLANIVFAELKKMERINQIGSISQVFEHSSKSVQQLIHSCEEIEKIAFSIKNSTDCLFLSKDILYVTCMEAALKMKELSYIHAEAIPIGELKHGSLALIDENIPIFVFYANYMNNLENFLSAIEEIVARSGTVYFITDKADLNMQDSAIFDRINVFYMPSVSLFDAPVVFTVFAQLLSYFTAKFRCKNIDRPRNLAKSVTVE